MEIENNLNLSPRGLGFDSAHTLHPTSSISKVEHFQELSVQVDLGDRQNSRKVIRDRLEIMK